MTALSDLGLAQTAAGAGVEVWAQTLREDISEIESPGAWYDATWLKTFNGGIVHLLQRPPRIHDWRETRGCAIWPTAIDEAELKLGGDETPIVLETAFYWRENARTRQAKEASYEDLAWYMRAAALSQPALVWKGSWTASPPAGSIIVQAGPGFAVRHARIFPVEITLWLDQDREARCRGIIASFVVAWVQKRIQLEC